jgi:hypothetical protein
VKAVGVLGILGKDGLVDRPCLADPAGFVVAQRLAECDIVHWHRLPD